MNSSDTTMIQNPFQMLTTCCFSICIRDKHIQRRTRLNKYDGNIKGIVKFISRKRTDNTMATKNHKKNTREQSTKHKIKNLNLINILTAVLWTCEKIMLHIWHTCMY